MGSNGAAEIQPTSALVDPGPGLRRDERVGLGLGSSVSLCLNRRLLRESRRPLAVALSGGGDSLALTLLADAWARGAGRELLILTVDHRLQAQSTGWTKACAAVAQRLERPFRALTWTGDKPSTGVPAAARAARHRLLADAAREAGARVLLMGHTADDILESRAMREAGATTPDPREWAPSPAWPQGRGLFVFRPLLDVRRAELRAWLTARGETWIDDPANDDPHYARSRARAALGEADPKPGSEPTPLHLAARARHEAGVTTLDRGDLREAAPEDALRFVALAAVCAGGGDRRPAAPRIARVAEALRGAEPLVATLAGARIEADETTIRLFREAGEAARGGLASAIVKPGRPFVWDGRFEVVAVGKAQEVRRLAGLARRLAPAQQRALHDVPSAARGALPALVNGDNVTCPALTGEAADLIPERLRAAAGLVTREPA